MDHLRLDSRFTFHPATDNKVMEMTQAQRYELIRGTVKSVAMMLADYCPGSPELTMAINSLDQAVMWANASIARNE